jgi:hypothetical protein
VTAVEKAPTILTEAGARRLTARIRDALALADDLLVQAWQGRAWEPLGHGSWEEYVAAELPQLRLIRLSVPDRRERAAAMRDAGMSYRAIAATMDVSEGTIRNDLRDHTGPEVVVSLDGARRPARGHRTPAVDPYEGMSRTEETLARVRAQGDRGLTSVELGLETDWPVGSASGALSKLERRGLIRRVPVFRANRAAYVAAPC